MSDSPLKSIYPLVASAYVRRYMKENGVSVDRLAREVGLTRGTFYHRLQGNRPWRVEELDALASFGVPFPALGLKKGKPNE